MSSYAYFVRLLSNHIPSQHSFSFNPKDLKKNLYCGGAFGNDVFELKGKDPRPYLVKVIEKVKGDKKRNEKIALEAEDYVKSFPREHFVAAFDDEDAYFIVRRPIFSEIKKGMVEKM